MRARRTLYVLVPCVVLVVIAGRPFFLSPPKSGENGTSQKAVSPAEFGLFVAPECLDIGTVWETSQFKWVLPIDNRSTKDVQIKGFWSSCVCADITQRSLQIPAHEKRDLELLIDLTPKLATEAQGDIHELRVSIHPEIETASGRRIVLKDWQVFGKVRPVLRLSARVWT
ncbi:MAG: hypothetical protein L0215_23150 [Gemmataceae bacterium]|nr:hypothetical protein [Gemmataceae bacterium]